MSKIVIALGGNALGKDPKEQIKLLEGVARIIVDLVKSGNKAFKTMNFQKAEEHLKICLKQDENSVIANTYMARIRLIQNNTRDAEMFIDKALINAPHDQIILYFKSCIYAQKSDKIRAFVYLKKAVENGLKGKRNIKMDKVWQKYLNDREFQEIISKIQ